MESQVVAVVWLAHGGALIRAAPVHLVDTSLIEVASPDSALPGASWLRDLRNLRRNEYADLGNPPTESERLDAWQDPDGREQQQYGHLFPPSPDPDDSPRLQNEPGSSSRVGQPIQVDEPDHAVIPGGVEMQGEEFEVGANDENPNFQRVPDQPSDENPHVESQSPQSSEPRLPHPRRPITTQQFERNVRARQSTSSVPPAPSSEAALAFSADSLTAGMFENPEDDWLATASSRARARVEVNIKKLTADERAQFRAAQH